MTLPITGYADKLSVSAGERVEFKVSSSGGGTYRAWLVRIITCDPNPAGQGITEESLENVFQGMYPGRYQPTNMGSHGYAGPLSGLPRRGSFSIVATVFPTVLGETLQALVGTYDTIAGGMSLAIDELGHACCMVGSGGQANTIVRTDAVLHRFRWYRMWTSFDITTSRLSVGSAMMCDGQHTGHVHITETELDSPPQLSGGGFCRFATISTGNCLEAYFNGKIERPRLLGRAIQSEEVEEIARGESITGLVADWDFSLDMSRFRIVDRGPHGWHGSLVNAPTRAVTGSNWTGDELCWYRVPEQYGAIHFHDDDLYDCGWETDFSFDVPDRLKSGVYAMRLLCGEHEDMIPFYVRPRRGSSRADVCVLIPTFTYIAYGNHARNATDQDYRDRIRDWDAYPWTPDDHDEYGLSTYNVHRDGSGVVYAGRLRPLINMRSGYVTFVESYVGSGVHHFPADGYLLGWLEHKGYDYDVATDEDLHCEGSELLAAYRVVITTSHPEYQTLSSWSSIREFVDHGGRLMYLGGNGFYWRIAVNPEVPGLIEVRRNENGVRSWATKPGEYYHSLDGTYGGLLRQGGRAPQELVGVGFTAQGRFQGTYYRRTPDSYGERVNWIFEDVHEEILGDFGYAGGGAAGYEIDRFDSLLGSPIDTVVLARSEKHPNHMELVPEDRLFGRMTTNGESPDSLVRADMVYFSTPGGGAVFSVGSITYCGSLPWNDYDNNISRVTENVLDGFLQNDTVVSSGTISDA